MMQENLRIWRVSLVRDRVKNRHAINVSSTLIAQVLRSDFRMRYKKLKKIPFAGNSDRALSLRFMCSKVLLDALLSGKVLVSLDESWLAEADMRNRCWAARSGANSIMSRDFGANISILMAMASDGRCYSALSHANTNADTFRMFLWRLIGRLAEEDRAWRDNTVIVHDGATYFRSETVEKFIQQQGIPTITLAPYGYNISPAELYFAQLKSGNINPARQKLGKK